VEKDHVWDEREGGVYELGNENMIHTVTVKETKIFTTYSGLQKITAIM